MTAQSTSIRDQDIVLVSNQMLHDRYWTSKQYIAMELVKSNRVLYVEANYSFGKLALGILKRKWPVVFWRKSTRDKSGIYVLTPSPRLPWRNHVAWIGKLNQWLLYRHIRVAVRHFDLHPGLIWSFLHQTARVVKKLKYDTAIYHCVDDWPQLLPLAGMGKPAQIRFDESELIKAVDLIISVSENLLQDYSIPETKYAFIPNGVDTALFNLSPDNASELPLDLTGLPRPFIGFSGSLGKWIDIDLIIHTARANPKASLIIIGLNEKNPAVEKMRKIPGIHFLGMKPRTTVPIYLRAFDVCLMPFNQSKVGQGLLPLKLFEYLALGKAIVATYSRSLEPFEDVLYLAKTAESFQQKVKSALMESRNDLIRKRIQRAEAYSWQARIQAYGKAIKSVNSSTQ